MCHSTAWEDSPEIQSSANFPRIYNNRDTQLGWESAPQQQKEGHLFTSFRTKHILSVFKLSCLASHQDANSRLNADLKAKLSLTAIKQLSPGCANSANDCWTSGAVNNAARNVSWSLRGQQTNFSPSYSPRFDLPSQSAVEIESPANRMGVAFNTYLPTAKSAVLDSITGWETNPQTR